MSRRPFSGPRPRARRPCRRPRRGSILFVAIGAVAVLSILALGTTSSVIQELRLARSVSRASESFYAAQAAVHIAQILLTHDDTAGSIVQYDLRPREVAFADKRLHIELFDEESLLPLERATADELVRLPGLDDGAVASDLAQAPIVFKEDAMRVNGVTPEIYAQFAPYVTTFSRGAVNINTAGPAVLTALGMDLDLIKGIQEMRAGADGQEGTRDDFWFLAAGSIATELQQNAGISDADVTLITNLVAQNKLGVSSDHVRVEAAVATGAREEKKVKAVLHLPSANILGWYEE